MLPCNRGANLLEPKRRMVRCRVHALGPSLGTLRVTKNRLCSIVSISFRSCIQHTCGVAKQPLYLLRPRLLTSRTRPYQKISVVVANYTALSNACLVPEHGVYRLENGDYAY
jgi:hypothetical protein